MFMPAVRECALNLSMSAAPLIMGIRLYARRSQQKTQKNIRYILKFFFFTSLTSQNIVLGLPFNYFLLIEVLNVAEHLPDKVSFVKTAKFS